MKVFELFENSQGRWDQIPFKEVPWDTDRERDALEFAEDLVHHNNYSIADAMNLVQTNFQFADDEIQRIRHLFMERNRDLL